MKATYIDYGETNSFSDTLLSYLSHDPKLEPYISCWPDPDSFGRLLSAKEPLVSRNVLVRTLKDQYSAPRYHNTQSDKVFANIDSLSNPTTYTITTGHQLNIFTGPLYFIYKIVTAINLANQLKARYPDKNFVPVYWMATEDHDFAEINHTRLHGKKFSWDEKVSGATGRIDPSSIEPTLKAYQSALGISENAEKLTSILREAYLCHNTLADATRFLVHSLFSKYGLVVIDADNADLKKQFIPHIKEDVVNQKSFAAINKTSKELEDAGFHTQVHSREINFFYLKDKLRERIVFEDGKWQILNTSISFNKDEIISEIEQFPEKFSPNVVMRPLYQEVILPNLAYVGGGAEIIYWLQLKQNFEHFGVSFPILVPRNSALIAGPSFSTKLDRLKLTIKDIFKAPATIQKEWVLAKSEHQLNLKEEYLEFDILFEKLKSRATRIDTTLAPSTEAIKARLKKALSNLEQKLVKAEKRNHQDALSQIEHLREKYFPGQGLQERTENFGLLYTQYGDHFIESLIQHFKPLDFKFTILEP